MRRTRATKLMVSWNCRNFRMLANTERPHSTDLTMLLKLSSMITMSAAALATSVPVHSRSMHCNGLLQSLMGFVYAVNEHCQVAVLQEPAVSFGSADSESSQLASHRSSASMNLAHMIMANGKLCRSAWACFFALH